jgi:hypothetical protein
VRLRVLLKLKNFIHPIGSRTHDLPACSIVPQSLRYSAPQLVSMYYNYITFYKYFTFLVLIVKNVCRAGENKVLESTFGKPV